MKSRLLTSHLCVLVALSAVDGENVIVNTTSGPIRGARVDGGIACFFAFYSVPYAQPPVGELRFKLPSPVNQWEGIHDATKRGPMCIQPEAHFTSENCLTLNIYTRVVSDGTQPVFVWLHPGALETGFTDVFGPDHFITYGVVVVTLQFRLGMLGYLNLGINDAPGNMGLADVIEALKWIKNNIRSFGGDPNKVTLGGVSSGGIMTHALLLSPKAEGLFQQVIIQSGTALSYRFYHDEVQVQIDIDNTKAALGMYSEPKEEILNKLQKLSTLEIILLHQSIKNKYPTDYAEFRPYVLSKDYFGIIPEDPLLLMKRNKYPHLPMIIGRTSNEGNRLAKSSLDFIDKNFHIVVPTDLFPIDVASKEKLLAADIIRTFYFGNNKVNSNTFSALAQLCTDSWYGVITDYVIKLATYQGYGAPIFYYEFSVDGAYNAGKSMAKVTVPGAMHLDDIGYLFKLPSYQDRTTQDDYSDLTRLRMVDMWSNFIINGNPTPSITELIPLKWEAVKYPGNNYLVINRTLTMDDNPMGDRGKFWISLYGLHDAFKDKN